MKLDQLDLRIISLLQDSNMLTPKLTKMAELLGSTNATIFRRVEALKKEGIIVAHTTIIDSKLAGKSIQAIVYLRLSKGQDKLDQEKTARRLSELGGVETIYLPISHWNYVIFAKYQSIDELNSLVQEELSKLPIDRMEVELVSKTIAASSKK